MSTKYIHLRLFVTAVLAVSVLCSQVGFAEQVKGLYKVTLPVASQSQSALKKATRAGLETVFIRVSGSQGVINQQQIAETINNASSYVKQFRYARVNRPKGGTQLQVSLEFESEQVDKALRDAGLPLWPSNRPTVLVWMVVEDRKSRRFASNDTDPEVVRAIRRHATRRGLAVKLPLLDLEDNLSVTPNQVWRLNSEKALLAAKRYEANTVLVGRVTHLNNGQWLGAWAYLFGEQRIRFDGDARSIDRYISDGLDLVADKLAAQYAIVPVSAADNGLLMRLTGINNFSDYARAISYLENVAAIRYANVINIQEDEIIVNLKADGLLEQLRQSLALDRRLQPAASSYQGEYDVVLDYRWPERRR